MTVLATRSELIKLGSTLETSPESLGFLAEIPPDQLRTFRAAVYERLFADDREMFTLMASAIRRLPAGVASRLAQRAGPLIAARVATEMPAARAAAIAIRLPIPFVADACVFLDPRRTQDLLRRFPTALVVDLAIELVERGDFMTISRFVDFFPDEAVRAVIDSVEDERALLQVAFFMGSKNRVDHLFRLLSGGRMERLMRLVEDESPELLPQLLALMIHTGYALKRQIGDLAAAQDPSVLTGYVRLATDQGLWGDMLPVVGAMSETAREVVVNLPLLGEEDVQTGILTAADDRGLWGTVLPLIDSMDEANRAAVARIMAGRPAQTIERAAEAALMGEQWEPLLDLVSRMPRTKQDELVAILERLGEVDPQLSERVLRSADKAGLQPR